MIGKKGLTGGKRAEREVEKMAMEPLIPSVRPAMCASSGTNEKCIYRNVRAEKSRGTPSGTASIPIL